MCRLARLCYHLFSNQLLPWGLVHAPVAMEIPLSLALQSWVLDAAVMDSSTLEGRLLVAHAEASGSCDAPM